MAVLRDAESYPEQAVTGAMSSLVGLRAIESLALIRRAFELGKIDEHMRGPWGMDLDELGVAPEPDDPLLEESQRRFDEERERMFPSDLRASLEAYSAQHRAQQAQAERQAAVQRRKQEQTRRQKAKRKVASASRKANRRKR